MRSKKLGWGTGGPAVLLTERSDELFHIGGHGERPGGTRIFFFYIFFLILIFNLLVVDWMRDGPPKKKPPFSGPALGRLHRNGGC